MTAPLIPFEQAERLKKTKFAQLLVLGHLAGWKSQVWYGTPHFKLFGLPDANPSTEDVVDVQLLHPLTEVGFLVRFRAHKIHGHWGVYGFDAVRCCAPKVLRNGGSVSQVLHYMGANTMGCPR